MDAEEKESIHERLARVLDRIGRAAERAGRRPDSVRLVGATKTVPVEQIREAVAGGLRLAGENRLQEALPKIRALQSEPIAWHFIGRLQRRKVRDVIGIFKLIHSVDSLDLAAEIDRRAGTAHLRQDVLLEVNVGGELTKGGFRPEEVQTVLPRFVGWDHIKVIGLMTIPPPVQEAEQARPYFRRMRELAKRLSELNVPGVSMEELSMGMSHDYVAAVEEGATIIRVGTAIFGARSL